VGFSPDGTLVATPMLMTTDGFCGLKLWKVPTLERVADLSADALPLWSAAFLADGRHLVMGTFNGDLVVWDVARREVVEVIKEHNSGISSITAADGAPSFVTTALDHRKLVGQPTAESWRAFVAIQTRLRPLAGRQAGRHRQFRRHHQPWDAPRDVADLITTGSQIAGFTPDSRTLVLAPGSRYMAPPGDPIGGRGSSAGLRRTTSIAHGYLQRRLIGALATDGTELWDQSAETGSPVSRHQRADRGLLPKEPAWRRAILRTGRFGTWLQAAN
jgi:hypothetical protein